MASVKLALRKFSGIDLMCSAVKEYSLVSAIPMKPETELEAKQAFFTKLERACTMLCFGASKGKPQPIDNTKVNITPWQTQCAKLPNPCQLEFWPALFDDTK